MYREVPGILHSSPAVVTTPITIVQYQSQETDVGTIHEGYGISAVSYTLHTFVVCLYSSVQFYHMYRLV